MGQINIANSAGRDAAVITESVSQKLNVRWVDKKNRQAHTVRILKAPVERNVDAMLAEFGDISNIAQAMVKGDPEIDFENSGRFLSNTSRVYIDKHGKIVHKVQFWEIIRNPDGSERERRPRKIADPNLSGESPIRWSGKFVDKMEAARKFVFSGKVQLHHVNGLTYDFLYEMAKELEEKNCLMLLGAGPKSNQPLILRRGGSPYRGFLEGRTQGDKYCLILHFSNLELKTPEESEQGESAS